MNPLEKSLKILGKIYKKLDCAYASGNRRSDCFTEIGTLLVQMEELAGEKTARKTIDKALQDINITIERYKTDLSVNDYIKHPSENFFRFEVQLHQHMGIRKRDFLHLLDTVYQNLETGQMTPDMIDTMIIPATAKQLVELTKLQIEKAKNDLAEAFDKPRKIKKKEKTGSLERFALGMFGAGLSIGDVLLSLPSLGLTAPVAIASITTGVLSLGASVFNAPELLKQLKSPPALSNDEPEEDN